ncbi:hypothetical protein [Pseudooceanicola algae]|uniref:Uncharacterized protein n=1 Tax=Pseudooceanicola algae TaxID=1537215 RepID=A0A418SFF8_9RHOB|nr:hypothetical protein [Pseudooceanicola algae]QPM89315.1 hypothetical protein PSAL_005300 [Pseudooceanicola algae]
MALGPGTPVWTGLTAALIFVIPLLAGWAMWHRRRIARKAAETSGFNAGPATAVVWLIWALAFIAGLLPAWLSGSYGLFVSVLLFGFTLWDWLTSLRGARWRAGDFATALLSGLLAALLIWIWVIATPTRPTEAPLAPPPAKSIRG